MRVYALVLVSFFLFCYVTMAQGPDATITGRILDPGNASVAGARVEVVNSETGVKYLTETNGEGIYTVPNLQPGIYRMEVSKPGFKALLKPDVVLHVQDVLAINFNLPLGSVSETVTVSSGGINMNTTDGSVGTVIDRKFVENTPLNGRSFQDLILLTPGVVTQSPQSNNQASGVSGDFSVNGQRTESNSYMVDGVSANTNPGTLGVGGGVGGGSIPSSTVLGTTQSLISVDALEEFRVDSSTYSAEYGRTPGGQFSFVTRSGTDDFHGGLYDYLRNNYFDANNYFSNFYKTKQPALRQNDFGGTLGGPVTIPGVYGGKGKTFFFVSYEGLRLLQPQAAALEYVPTLSLRQQSPGTIQAILNAFPVPTPGGTDYGNGLAEFIQSDSLPSVINSTSVRLDHVLASKVRLFFRFSDTPSSTASRLLSVYTPNSGTSRTYTLGVSSQVANNQSNEFRMGLVDSNNRATPVIDGFGGATPLNVPEALGVSTSSQAGVNFILSFPGNLSYLHAYDSSNVLRQWNITDTYSWLLGRHSIKAGIDFRKITATGAFNSATATYIYTNQSQVVSNQALLADGFVQLPAAPIYHQFSAFLQDQWRLLDRLTISLGLRWEVDPPPTAKNSNIPYTLQGSISSPSSLTLAPKGTPLWRTTWYNFAPRLGVAWRAHIASGHDTVVRAGGGVYFDATDQSASAGYQSVGFFAEQQLFGAPAPFPGGINLNSIPISVAPPYTNTNVYYPNPHLQLPYTLEWSVAVEQALGQAQTLTVTYIGSDGRRLLGLNEFSSSNPEFGQIFQSYNGPTSNYQALQTQFQRTVSHGLQVLASYSWSHSLDYGSNEGTLPLVRGNSDFDVRNNFTAGMTWNLPNAHSNRIANAVLNDWALDGHFIGRSAFPITLGGNILIDPANGTQYDSGVNLVPGQPIYLYGAQYPGGRSVNPAAFSLPTGNQSGNAPRNFVRGFGATQVNLAVRREFHLNEKLGLQFRAEVFNALNHANFGYVDPLLGDNTFGQATQTLNESLLTGSPLYQMGGPRSMQFALKLQF